MANSFSLLRLPNEERLQVLRCMDRRILILLSLLSQKTKDLVRSLQLKPVSSPLFPVGRWLIPLENPRFGVWFNGGTVLSIGSWDVKISFYEDPEDNMERLVKPRKVWIKIKEGTGFNTRWTEREFPNHLEIREWYEHILYIINPRQETELGFTGGCLRFDLGAIKTVFGKFDSLGFNFDEPRDFVSKGLNTFLPDLKKLRLQRNPYPQEGNRIQKLLIQNFDSLNIGCLTNQFERLNLEDLLICNAHHIKFGLNQKFDKINQFLKLWINGSNERLQKMTIEQKTRFNAKKIFEGIRIIREIPQEEEILFEENLAWQYSSRTRAVDIERYDGTRGTVIIMYERKIRFLVWN
ncbi:unnamed protein product [Caenorhabditis brenneri]